MAPIDDFDPTHALDGWRAPAPAPLQDLELGALLKAGGAGLDEAKRARLKARGYELRDVEDIELREVLAPRPAPAALPMPTAAAPSADARLLRQWQPQAWLALARRVRGATAEVLQTPKGPLVENRAPQWLCALWPPQRLDAPLLGRWPEQAALVGAETACGALHQLLPGLPAGALLWPAALEADWALVAELVLHHDSRLRPADIQALRELAEAERGASFARVNDDYANRGGVARRRA
jgi:hypothetical protein